VTGVQTCALPIWYGLDYDGHYRNHPEIVTLTDEAM